MSTDAKEPYLVLVADDSEDDRFLLKQAVSRTKQLEIIAEVSTGVDAINYMKGQAPFHDREKHPLPNLLLLDLKMPLKDGFAVLEWLQTQEFADMTVVVLTDSMWPEHIKRALDLGADLFQVKPKARADLEAMVFAMEEHLLRSIPTPLTRAQLSDQPV
jgi:CheY-like chemotaxis protein